MSEFKVKGKIKAFLEVQSGVSSSTNKEWKKQSLLVTNNDGYQGAEQLFCFEVFGVEKVDNLTKYNKVGQSVEVTYKVNTNEWKGKYYTSLSLWRIDKLENASTPEPVKKEEEDFVFDEEDNETPF